VSGAELLVIDTVEVGDRHGFAVRCHAGRLHVGEELTIGVDPEGRSRGIAVRCVEIKCSPKLAVDFLDANFGGGIVLEGDDVAVLGPGWTLRTS